MVIIMHPEATQENINGVIQTIENAGLEAKIMEGHSKRLLALSVTKPK